MIAVENLQTINELTWHPPCNNHFKVLFRNTSQNILEHKSKLRTIYTRFQQNVKNKETRISNTGSYIIEYSLLPRVNVRKWT